MVINILATHRFHVLDLARELSNLGHDVRFYSYVSGRRVEKFGFPSKNCINFLWLVLPFFALAKLFPNNNKWQFWVINKRNTIIDWYVSHTSRKCDVVIALGCIYTNSIKKAKSQGSIAILEWGSKHIIEQLKNFGRLDTYPEKQLASDLNEYELVDYISIPATHVKDSFIKHGVDEKKLLVNPYGVSLNQFSPTVCSNEFDLICVGGWRYEKGSDLLVTVCRKYGYKLLHVGAIINMEFPEDSNFTHVDPVDQSRLIQYYSKSKVFVLPSRSEGLSLVQAQAIACGLPVVCSKETGGIDLRSQISNREWVIEMCDFEIETLHNCIENALSLAYKQSGERNYTANEIDNLTWAAYGERYSENLKRIINESKR